MEKVRSREGIVIPAHVDRLSYSIISQLGFIPPHLEIKVVELSSNTSEEEAVNKLGLAGFRFLHSSDAHSLSQIGSVTTSFYSLLFPTGENWNKSSPRNFPLIENFPFWNERSIYLLSLLVYAKWGIMVKSGRKWEMFLGHYYHTIDEKNPVVIPSSFGEKFREGLSHSRNGKMYFLYPEEVWNRFYQKITTLSLTRKETREFFPLLSG